MCMYIYLYACGWVLFVITHTPAFIQSEAALKPKIGFEIFHAGMTTTVHSRVHNATNVYICI